MQRNGERKLKRSVRKLGKLKNAIKSERVKTIDFADCSISSLKKKLQSERKIGKEKNKDK